MITIGALFIFAGIAWPAYIFIPEALKTTTGETIEIEPAAVTSGYAIAIGAGLLLMGFMK